jgi:hypothetical protein
LLPYFRLGIRSKSLRMLRLDLSWSMGPPTRPALPLLARLLLPLTVLLLKQLLLLPLQRLIPLIVLTRRHLRN